jgi:membrane-bound lytic murein transglycosylase D
VKKKIMENKAMWYRKLYTLLFTCMVTMGLYAQSEAVLPTDSINRPQRSIRPNPPLPTPHSPLPTPHSSQFPLLTKEAINQPLTQRYIKEYSSADGVKWINSVIKNGRIYIPYIREEIAKRGLPPELVFLPFVESGYVSTARSRSGAAGLWQFMMNSVPRDMKVNDMIDERRDFRIATKAALRKLEENYRVLKDWPMTLAAYNAGLGGINRIVQRTKVNDYWRLCELKELKTETIHYVPKLLAVSYIVTQPRRFGIDWWPETTEWTAIKPGRQVSLDLIALESGADRALLYRLNPELLHGVTPPDKNYELKTPLAQAEIIAAILEREDVKLLRFYSYRIQYGDTLSALSRHYGISLELIEQHNPGITRRYLKIGETIIIPAYRETGPYVGGTVPTPAPAGQNRAGTFAGTHIVSKGDTLWSLAIQYGIDPQALAAANGMELNQILSIGKALKVPIIE